MKLTAQLRRLLRTLLRRPKCAKGGYIGPVDHDGPVGIVHPAGDYQHDLPDGRKDHMMRLTGKCEICGVQVFDPDRIRRALDRINQEDK